MVNTARVSIDQSQLVCCMHHNIEVHILQSKFHMHLWHILTRFLLLMSSTARALFIWVWCSRRTHTVMSPGHILDWTDLNFFLRLNYIELSVDSRLMLNFACCGETCCHMEYFSSPCSLIRLFEWTQSHRVILAQCV